jgi:DNA invertase Pin-like site-specific DNA recombinase
MRAALYARVSTERQAERGTIGSKLQLLRQHVTAAGDELVGEYLDDGHSGARLDHPGSTRCVMAPKVGCSSGCGACRRIDWPVPTPIRF